MLDVNQLSEKGCLRPGCSSTCLWIVNNEVVSINLRAEAGRLHLSYTVRVGNGGCEEMAETISIVHLRCRFGGSRGFHLSPLGRRSGLRSCAVTAVAGLLAVVGRPVCGEYPIASCRTDAA
jgi:hypothetical protein